MHKALLKFYGVDMATAAIKNGLGTVVRFLNQPSVKEGVKNIVGIAAFTFGIIEAYDIYQILRGREISTETNSAAPKWIQVATKVALVCAKISLILSAVTSRPGVFIISTMMGCLFSTAQLQRVFGPNAIFAVNPWHPRHIFSVAAVVLALPSVIHSAGKGIQWVYTKICQHENVSAQNNERQGSWLTDTKVRLMALFNTITSRPVQHLGNRLCRVITT